MQRRPEFARIRTCLAGSVHFRALPAKDLDRIAALGRLIKLDDARPLQPAGARPESFWIVLSGCLRVASTGKDGEEFVYALLGAGSFFGLGYVLMDEPLGVEARAYGATELAAIDGARFTALLDQLPGLWRHVATLLCRRLSIAMIALRDISSAPLSQRIVRRLVGQAISRGADPVDGARIELRLTQSDLAVMLGASRSKVNAELKRLESAGLIEVGYRVVALRDLARLRALAGSGVFAF
jgi:CRP/FNR family transcriptional regulator, cyclic AMP receptor protein